MMDRSEVRAKFLELVKQFSRKESDAPIEDDALLERDLNTDSSRMIDIVLETEDAFHITIDDASLDRMKTVGGSVDLIMERLAESK
jgi:acyl carrier protein